MKFPALHSHGHSEASQEEHVGVLHVLHTHLKGGRGAPSGQSPITYYLGPRLLPKSPRQLSKPDTDFKGSLEGSVSVLVLEGSTTRLL